MDGIGIKRRHLDEQTWRELLGRFEGCGMSVISFCKREGVSANSFRRWRARLAPTPSIQTVPQGDVATEQSATGFIELGSYGAAGVPAGRLDLKLDLGGGLSLHLVRS
jgi:putative transposase